MASSVSVKNAQGQLACSVCQNKANEIVLSSCFHTFCINCLQVQTSRSLNKKNYLCPLCKALVTLPRNFHGNNETRIYEKSYRQNQELEWKSDFCDICLDNKIAVNRCLQCNESFCENCTNAHLRMKASRYHGQLVVPFRNRGLERSKDIARDTKYCTRHRNQEVVVVCQQCRVPICLVCKLMEHPNHVTKTVAEDAREIREKLSEMLHNQIGYSEDLQIRIRQMNDTTNQYPIKLDQELRKVELQAMKLHKAIETERSNAEKELVTCYDDFTTRSARLGEYLKQDYNDYLTLAQAAGEMLESDNDVLIVKKGEYVYEKLKSLDSHTKPTTETKIDGQEKKFLASKIDDSQVSNLIGKITLNEKGKVVRIWSADNSVPENNARRESVRTVQGIKSASSISSRGQNTSIKSPELLNQIWLPFTDGLGYVYGIAPAGSQQVWVSLLGHKYITLIDQQGLVLRRVEIGQLCEDLASDGEGGCFISCPQNKSIKRVMRNGEIITVIDNLIHDPHGIATLVHYDIHQFQLQQELFVCLTEPKSLDMNTDPNSKVGCVCTLSFTGSDLGISIPLKAPVRIAVSADRKTLAIVDHANGCVMVTDKSGQLVHALHCGQDDGKQFQPLGVCFDGKGRVLFADWTNGKICRMSPDGTCVQDLIINLDGPQSLAVSDGNVLWVGGKLGKIYIYRLTE